MSREPKPRPPAPRPLILSTMAGLAVAAREIKIAEGYLLELLAYCTFTGAGDNTVDRMIGGA